VNSLDDLTDDQKKDVMELVILTVKEIREQIAQDIEATIPLWKRMGYLKSRKTAKAFKVSAAIARGLHEKHLADNIQVETEDMPEKTINDVIKEIKETDGELLDRLSNE
jgi:hypothetical protein